MMNPKALKHGRYEMVTEAEIATIDAIIKMVLMAVTNMKTSPNDLITLIIPSITSPSLQTSHRRVLEKVNN
jgi:hypothetical protein